MERSKHPTIRRIALATLAGAWSAAPLSAAHPWSVAPRQDVTEGRAVLELLCVDCHRGSDAEAGFDLASLLAAKEPAERLFEWRRARAMVESGAMPPPGDAADEVGLDASETRDAIAWLDHIEDRALKLGGAAGHEPVRRLTRGELGRSLDALLGVRVDIEALMPAELLAQNAFETNASTLFVHPEWLLRADASVRAAIDAADLRAFAPPTKAPDLDTFLRRAFRRPPSPLERERYAAAFARRIERGAAAEDALRATLFDVLSSPHFRLRLEGSVEDTVEGEPAVARPVGPFGLASRLSFLFWSAPPDDRLLDLAESAQLLEPKTFASETKRLLDDDRALAFARLFAGQWLGTSRLGREIKPDPIDNPEMTDSVMAAMRDEVARFVLMLLREDRPLEDLFRSDVTFVDEELARFYGHKGGVPGSGRIRLRDPRRRGLFGKAAVLACTSYPDRTSPVLRGAWILDDLLGTPPPPPPPGASEVDDDVVARTEDQGPRALLELHRASPACASCHDRIDPLGFALEGFDHFGRTVSGADASGKLPSGATFRGPRALGRVLVKEHRAELSREITRRLLRYALARPLDWRDERTIEDLAAVLAKEGFGALLDAVLQSHPFRHCDPA